MLGIGNDMVNKTAFVDFVITAGNLQQQILTNYNKDYGWIGKAKVLI